MALSGRIVTGHNQTGPGPFTVALLNVTGKGILKNMGFRALTPGDAVYTYLRITIDGVVVLNIQPFDITSNFGYLGSTDGDSGLFLKGVGNNYQWVLNIPFQQSLKIERTTNATYTDNFYYGINYAVEV